MNRPQQLVAFVSFLTISALAASSTAMAGASVAVPVMSVGLGAIHVQESSMRVEANLFDEFGLLIEGSFIQKGEGLSKERMEETSDSIFVDGGNEFTLLLARYSDPRNLAGFFYMLGAGYRTMETTWKHVPPEGDEGYALLDRSTLDDEGRFQSSQKVTGTTGHGRLGYRYIGESFPFLVGGCVGVRHYQSRIEDVEGQDDEPVVALSDEDRRSLKNQLMTTLLTEITVGFVF